jgi:hypothetical protein
MRWEKHSATPRERRTPQRTHDHSHKGAQEDQRRHTGRHRAREYQRNEGQADSQQLLRHAQRTEPTSHSLHALVLSPPTSVTPSSSRTSDLFSLASSRDPSTERHW